MVGRKYARLLWEMGCLNTKGKKYKTLNEPILKRKLEPFHALKSEAGTLVGFAVLSYKDSVPISVSQNKDTHDWWLETMFYYSAGSSALHRWPPKNVWHCTIYGGGMRVPPCVARSIHDLGK